MVNASVFETCWASMRHGFLFGKHKPDYERQSSDDIDGVQADYASDFPMTMEGECKGDRQDLRNRSNRQSNPKHDFTFVFEDAVVVGKVKKSKAEHADEHPVV